MATIESLEMELEQIGEESRTHQNQIVSTISTCGTVLGILLTATYFVHETINDPVIWITGVEMALVQHLALYFTKARLMFWLVCLTFLVGFFHIITIGIQEIVLYYHSQEVWDKLHSLEADHENPFIRYNEKIAPIITHNPEHIRSFHAAAHLISYDCQIMCLLLFCLAMTLAQYFEINPRNLLDIIVLSAEMSVFLAATVMYLYSAHEGQKVANFAENMARLNMLARLKGNKTYDSDADRLIRKALYYIYPRQNTIQKICVIPIGIIFGSMCGYYHQHIVFNGILVVIIFELLLYAIRYQINDFRSTDDKRYVFDEESEKRDTKIALAVMGLRALIFLTLMISASILKWYLIKPVWFYTGLLLASTIVYEYGRISRNNNLVFSAVGLGYPIRFFMGLSVVYPGVSFASLELSYAIKQKT